MYRINGGRGFRERGGWSAALESRKFASGRRSLEPQSAAVALQDWRAVSGAMPKVLVQAARRHCNTFDYRYSYGDASHEWRPAKEIVTGEGAVGFRNQTSCVFLGNMRGARIRKEEEPNTRLDCKGFGCAGERHACETASPINARVLLKYEAAGIGVAAIASNAIGPNKERSCGYHNRHLRRQNPLRQSRETATVCTPGTPSFTALCGEVVSLSSATLLVEDVFPRKAEK